MGLPVEDFVWFDNGDVNNDDDGTTSTTCSGEGCGAGDSGTTERVEFVNDLFSTGAAVGAVVVGIRRDDATGST